MEVFYFRTWFCKKLVLLRITCNTVHPHNKHTPNKHIPHNKHTLFALTKMCLFGEEEDFGKINSLYFFNIESLKTHFLLFLKNCVMQDWIWGFLGNFWSSFSGTNSRVTISSSSFPSTIIRSCCSMSLVRYKYCLKNFKIRFVSKFDIFQWCLIPCRTANLPI